MYWSFFTFWIGYGLVYYQQDKLKNVAFNYLDLFHIEMGVGTSFDHGKFLQKKYEYRLACHLSKEMNIVVANDVTNALEIGKWKWVIRNP